MILADFLEYELHLMNGENLSLVVVFFQNQRGMHSENISVKQ